MRVVIALLKHETNTFSPRPDTALPLRQWRSRLG